MRTVEGFELSTADQLRRARAALRTGQMPPALRQWVADQLAQTPAAIEERDRLIRQHIGRLGGGRIRLGCGRLLEQLRQNHPAVQDLVRLGAPIPGERQLRRIASKKSC